MLKRKSEHTDLIYCPMLNLQQNKNRAPGKVQLRMESTNIFTVTCSELKWLNTGKQNR
jgi:hypothetical protein